MQQFVRMVQETAYFLGSLIRIAYRSVTQNKGLAVISVVLAFGIWIVVTEADNPSRSRVFDQDLVIEPVNVPDDAAVVKPIPDEAVHVRVRVAAPDDVFNGLTPADFRATVDLQGLTVGDYDVPVHVEPIRGSVRVEAVLPEEISVHLAPLISKQVPVSISVEGAPLPGYTMSTPQPDDDSVLVSGPQSQVDKVAEVTGTINVEGKSESIDGVAVRLSARDGNGNLIPYVTIRPALTNVSIDMEQDRFSRSMVVEPKTSGEPAPGYNIISVTVNPPLVTVQGDQAYIAGTSSIATKPIDIAGAEKTIVKTVSLDLPSGAQVTGGVAVVTVTITIQPANGIFSYSVPVTVRNLGSDVAVNGGLPSVTVTLYGPLPDLEDLSPNGISASIDLDGKDAGVHKIVVDVTAPNGAEVRGVAPAQIDVTLVPR